MDPHHLGRLRIEDVEKLGQRKVGIWNHQQIMDQVDRSWCDQKCSSSTGNGRLSVARIGEKGEVGGPSRLEAPYSNDLAIEVAAHLAADPLSQLG